MNTYRNLLQQKLQLSQICIMNRPYQAPSQLLAIFSPPLPCPDIASGTLHIVFPPPVRVKDGMSLRNGMWHGVRNGIIMRNTIFAGNKLTEERVMFSRQFYKSSSFFDSAESC